MATAPAILNDATSRMRFVAAKRILIIEEDSALQNFFQRLFSSEGYEVEVVSDAPTALEALHRRAPSALILDVGDARRSQCDVCSEVFRCVPELPFLVLSASKEVEHMVLFLEMGADDYVTTPFDPRELVAVFAP